MSPLETLTKDQEEGRYASIQVIAERKQGGKTRSAYTLFPDLSRTER